jgi:hypothetical protein
MADTTKVQNLDELRASVTRQQGAVRQLKADGADQVRGCLSERVRLIMYLVARLLRAHLRPSGAHLPYPTCGHIVFA